MITSAKYLSYEQLSVNTFRIHVSLTDDVKGVFEDGFIASGSTVAELRDDVSRQIAARNAANSTKSVLDGIAVNTAIPVTAPAAPAVPALTATQIWVEKAKRLARLRALGTVSGTLAAAITTLAADVDATYQAGFVDAM
jgi:hypothetical protein